MSTGNYPFNVGMSLTYVYGIVSRAVVVDEYSGVTKWGVMVESVLDKIGFVPDSRYPGDSDAIDRN